MILKVFLIYLLIGTGLSILLEIFWKHLEDEEEYGWSYRILTITVWPVILILGLIYVIRGYEDGDEPEDTNDLKSSGAH